MTATPNSMKIDIVSDVVCPWCYVGKKKLEIALGKMQDEVQAEIQWRPFQLSPEVPEEGRDYKDHLVEKFGSLSGLDGAWKRLTQIGSELGIDFKFEDIEKSVNTLRLHALIGSLGDAVSQDKVAEIFFRAHFENGLDLTQKSVVFGLVKDFFKDEAAFDTVWDDDKRKEEIRQEISYYHQNGISGVPYFIFQNKYAVSGAQNPEVFIDVMRTILKEESSNKNL
ncbi:DsbA family oxidoreductase [Leptospira ognonensis]|uniref:DsbA family oxidoreductase n=1 Tax=Leptospira ognonensis TaxID=2484945 RepID=A0A4R9JY04_9LEPT|nr:DsbA family oxidoreductase [Leptospira ognonensis]TGL56377.1 DsbA family oxidoreductase [Leptospira ognonensis]